MIGFPGLKPETSVAGPFVEKTRHRSVLVLFEFGFNGRFGSYSGTLGFTDAIIFPKVLLLGSRLSRRLVPNIVSSQ